MDKYDLSCSLMSYEVREMAAQIQTLQQRMIEEQARRMSEMLISVLEVYLGRVPDENDYRCCQMVRHINDPSEVLNRFCYNGKQLGYLEQVFTGSSATITFIPTF